MTLTYVSKPVIVEAFALPAGNDTATVQYPSWVFAAFRGGILFTEMLGGVAFLKCKTKQGVVLVNDGDYLIKLEDGEIYPSNPVTFNAKYELLPTEEH